MLFQCGGSGRCKKCVLPATRPLIPKILPPFRILGPVSLRHFPTLPCHKSSSPRMQVPSVPLQASTHMFLSFSYLCGFLFSNSNHNFPPQTLGTITITNPNPLLPWMIGFSLFGTGRVSETGRQCRPKDFASCCNLQWWARHQRESSPGNSPLPPGYCSLTSRAVWRDVSDLCPSEYRISRCNLRRMSRDISRYQLSYLSGNILLPCGYHSPTSRVLFSHLPTQHSPTSRDTSHGVTGRCPPE